MNGKVRKYKRLPKKFCIQWKNDSLEFDDITLDICPGGVFIVSNQKIPPGTVFDLKIVISHEYSVSCRGKVAWVNHGQLPHYPPGFGVEFLDLPEDITLWLLQLCHENEQEE